MTELISSLDEINATYPALKHIWLYINSRGGYMDSGYMAYEALRSSRTPVTTVNVFMTGSAATLLYCAAEERLTLPAARFLLHPAAVRANNDREYLQPNDISQLYERADRFNFIFKFVYRQCTTRNEQELGAMLFSEDNQRLITGDVALEKKLATGRATRVEALR